MALGDALAGLGASVLEAGHQRLELLALDVEEELLCTSRLLAGAVLAALSATLALAAGAALLVVLLWDTARLAALGGVTAFFFAATALLVRALARAAAAKPAFLAATLAELRKDREALAGGGR